MNQLRPVLAVLALALATASAFAQPLPVPQQGQPPNPEQMEEWVKQMRGDGLKMLAEGDAALAKGDEKTALNRYTAAHEIYKGAFLPEELQKVAADIIRLRAKLGVADHSQPIVAEKVVDLSNPEIAAKRTDALRLLSEAEQYLDEGKDQEAGRLLTRLYSRFNDALLAEEEARVVQGLITARERLGLPPMPPGKVDFMPYVVRSGDEEIDSLCMLFAGSFATDATQLADSQGILTFNSAAVPIEGLTNAVYFEVARGDDQPNPFRQGFFTFYRLDQQLRMRVLDIPGAHRRGALTSLWAIPDLFPAQKLDDLTVNADLVMTRNEDGSGYAARTPARVPTTKGGAVVMTSQIKINANGITIDDRGYDAAGAEVWRSGSESGIAFKRAAAPEIVTRKDSGLVIIDLVKGRGADALARAGDVAMHFSYWSANGNLINTSRIADRPPQRVRYPINFIKGLDEGLEGITAGTRRRVFIPAELAWGEQGNNWQVPANTPIVFDIECLWVQAPATPPPIPMAPDSTPPGPVNPGAARPPSGGGH